MEILGDDGDEDRPVRGRPPNEVTPESATGPAAAPAAQHGRDLDGRYAPGPDGGSAPGLYGTAPSGPAFEGNYPPEPDPTAPPGPAFEGGYASGPDRTTPSGPAFDGGYAPGARGAAAPGPAFDLGEQHRDVTWAADAGAGWAGESLGDHPVNGAPTVTGPAMPGHPGGHDLGGPAGAAVPPVTGMAAESGATPDMPRAASPRAQLASVVFGPESLALSGLLLAVATFIAMAPSMFMMLISGSEGFGESVGDFAVGFGGSGGISAALGLWAAARIRADTHPVLRACAGAAVLLGLLLVVIAAVGAIQASGAPPQPTPPGI